MKEVEKKDVPDVSGGYNDGQEIPALNLDYPPVPTVGPTCPDPIEVTRY